MILFAYKLSKAKREQGLFFVHRRESWSIDGAVTWRICQLVSQWQIKTINSRIMISSLGISLLPFSDKTKV